VLTQSQEKYREVLQVAENLYRQTPDWVTFFREVLGIGGAVRKRFPSFEELTSFEKSDEFDNIQKMLVKLREKRTTADPETEPTRVITVRLPKSMHEYLRTEAHDLRTSMNKLCISKLLQVIGEEMIPNERSGASAGGSSSSGSPSLSSQPTTAPAPQASTVMLSQPSAVPQTAAQQTAAPQTAAQQTAAQQTTAQQTAAQQTAAPSPFKPTSQPRF
jgi:predicted HicB family RNase H-like nuclease